ncbi:glutamate receptor 2.1-like [Daucus carota subsp. sativus]|uniref:glutamate receptor 2.1-like n=1 Tax=Daucus carota subsp. sativus TaxID=79200 RepID=UPI0007EF01C9|nr:PREDICTED: glutamate receptor 2.1-like [Daucus carota subsp. sativus]
MGLSNLFLYLLLFDTILLLLVSAKNETSRTPSKHPTVINVGLILDFNSSDGFVADSCISIALSDFYTENLHYATRLALVPKNSNDVLSAASAALELVNADQVEAIIGPQYYSQAKFVAEIGGKSQVPIISFSVTSSSFRLTRTPYFIQTTLPDSSQLKCVTSLVQQFGWSEIVVLYQNDAEGEPGNNFIPSLTDAFQQASIQLSYVISVSSSDSVSNIKKELKQLRGIQTRVFLVHVTSPDLASRIFSLANEVGMMSKGTAWIITDALSNSLSSLNAPTIELMEGVIGVRPYVPKSENLENFRIRWNKFLLLQQQPALTENISDVNLFCLRAYDTVWALATAVEKIQFPGINRSQEKSNASRDPITNMTISEAGPGLVKEILKTRFLGLSGEFKMRHGQLETPVLEIINIVGNGGNGDRTVGYWTPERGFSRKIASADEGDHGVVYSNQVDGVLKPIIWPGESTKKPKGWDVPGMGLKLRVGVPKKTGFTEFVDVQDIGNTKTYNVTGFSIDVFIAALDSLPFKIVPEFIPFVNDSGGSNGTYNDLVDKLSVTKNPEYEALVGDITIRAEREGTADFSLPYSESGVVKVVRAEPDRLKNMWIFLKPLSWDLWLTVVLSAISIGLVLHVLERRLNPQRQLGMLVLFPLAALAFPERNIVGNSWARFVLVVWLFMAYILMQSYTANLSSILTVGQLRPSTDTPSCAGYQEGSFVKEILTNWLKLSPANCYSYSSMEAYDRALSLGCKHGGVDAIYDEIPYIKLFLHKYGSKYKMAGATYSTGGFGFAFPTGSPLSKPISEAILNVMEKGTIQDIEKNYFGPGYTSQYAGEDLSRDSPSLTTYSFAGLFTITAFLTLLALICSECSFAISSYRSRNSINPAEDVPPKNEQDSEGVDEILEQEESHEQEVELTNANNDHGGG